MESTAQLGPYLVHGNFGDGIQGPKVGRLGSKFFGNLSPLLQGLESLIRRGVVPVL